MEIIADGLECGYVTIRNGFEKGRVYIELDGDTLHFRDEYDERVVIRLDHTKPSVYEEWQ